MSEIMVYSAEKKTIELDGKEEPFFCGGHFGDVEAVLCRLKFGTISLQDAYNVISNKVLEKVQKLELKED